MASNDPKVVAHELFNMLLSAASSTTRRSTSNEAKNNDTKNHNNFNKWLKEATQSYKSMDSAQKSRAAREQVLGRQYDDIIKKVNAFGASVEEAVENAKSLKELDKIPETVSKIFEKSSSNFVKQLSSQAKSLQGIFEIEKLATSRKSILSQLTNVTDRTKLTLDEYQRLNERMMDAGTNLESLGYVVKGIYANGKQTGVMLRTTTADLSSLKKETNDLAKAMDLSATTVNEKFSPTINKFAQEMKDITGELKQNFNQFASMSNVISALSAVASDFKKQREFGAADVSGIQALRLGVTLDQLTDQYVTHRMTILAMQSANKDVEQEMLNSASTYREFSRDNEQALRGLLGTLSLTSKFGISQDKLSNAVDKQAEIYKKSFRPLGYSIEQMNELSSQIVEDVDIRKQMASLGMGERRQMIEAKQARFAEIQAIYGASRAMEIFRTEQERATLSPKDRFKTAMMAEPAFATLGMAKQGREYRKLMLSLPGLVGPEKEKAQARLTAIESEVANRFQELNRDETKIGQAMAVQSAFESTGFSLDKLFGVSTAGTEGQQVNQQIATKTMEQGRELNSLIGDLLTGVNFVKSAIESSTSRLTLSIAAMVAASLATTSTIRATSAITHVKLENIHKALLSTRPPSGPSGPTQTPPSGKTPSKGMLSKLLRIGTPLALASGAWQAYDTVQTANTPEEMGSGLGEAAGSSVGSLAGGVATGALMGAAFGPVGAVFGALAGGTMGALGGGSLGSVIGKEIVQQLNTPSMQPESVINKSKVQSEQLNKDVAKNLATFIEEMKKQNVLSTEQINQLLATQQQLLGVTKNGFNQSTDAIKTQTDEMIRSNIQTSGVSLNRGSNPTGNAR